VTFQVPRPVFTLTIRLIDRLAVDAGTRGSSVLVVCIDIVDMDDQAGIRHIDGQGGVEMMLGGNVVQPDGCIPGAHFTMDSPTLRSSMDASGSEPERANQEVVCGCDVLIGEQRDYSFEGWHEYLRLTPLMNANSYSDLSAWTGSTAVARRAGT
jgi:hypothetical protein